MKLQVWDTAGQERFQTITTSYYHNSDGIAIVYDVTDRDSFDSVNHWFSDVSRLASNDVCTILIGNKSDLNEQRKIKTSEGKNLASSLGIPFLETSAKNANNVDEMFLKMASVIKQKKAGKSFDDLTYSNPKLDLNNGKPVESTSSCFC